jgi:hypothetical protein
VIDGEIKKAGNFNIVYMLIKDLSRKGDGRFKLDLCFPMSLSRQFYDDKGNMLIARMELATARVLKNGRSSEKTRIQEFNFVKRFDAEIDLNAALAKQSWDVNMLKGGKYTVYMAARVTDRLHSFCVAFGTGEQAEVEIEKHRSGKWAIVSTPIPPGLMKDVIHTLGL